MFAWLAVLKRIKTYLRRLRHGNHDSKTECSISDFTSLLLLVASSNKSVWDAVYERVQCSVWHANNTANMEKYRLVQEHKSEEEDFSETSNFEIRITQQGKPRNYISYAMNMFVRGPAKLYLCIFVDYVS